MVLSYAKENKTLVSLITNCAIILDRNALHLEFAFKRSELNQAFHNAQFLHAKTSPPFKLFSVARVNTNSHDV